MSVSLNLTMSGDFKNKRHRVVAEEICKAVEAVLEAHKDEFTYPPTTWSAETITSYKTRKFNTAETHEFREQGSGTQIVLNTGFHINEPSEAK